VEKSNTPQDQGGLERSVSLFQATVYGVGIILGAGIYALIGEAAGIAGNALWVSFVIAALIAACSAISYAELSSLYPKSAAEFVYVKEISGSPLLGFVVGYVTVVTGVIAALSSPCTGLPARKTLARKRRRLSRIPPWFALLRVKLDAARLHPRSAVQLNCDSLPTIPPDRLVPDRSAPSLDHTPRARRHQHPSR